MLTLGALLGCGCVRGPAREATYGFLDAVQHPPPDDRLALDLRTLAQRYVERALQAGPPKEPAEIVASITARVMEELAAHTPEQRRITAELVREAVEVAIRSADRELPSLARTGRRFGEGLSHAARGAGTMFTRGAMEETLAQLEPGIDEPREGPLSRALARAAQRTAGAVVHGAAEELRTEIALCEGRACGPDPMRAASRSAMMGAIEGVGRSIGPWLMAIAFVLGAIVTGGGVWLLRTVKRRPVG